MQWKLRPFSDECQAVSISPSRLWTNSALCYSTLRYANTQMGQQQQQPPAQTAVRTEASLPLSNVWIKVGLLPSCLHNNTLDRSSAAVGACGSDYLAGRRSLWLANGPGTVPVQASLNKSAELKLGHIPGETLINCLTLCTFLCVSLSFSITAQLGRLRMHLFRLALNVLSHSQSQWTGLIWIVTACL